MDRPEEVFYYEWYDGPRNGVANYKGTPYYFESQWKDLQDKAEDIYFLSSVSEEVRNLAIESWEIWKRWEISYLNGQINEETHPYLPEDEVRGKEIEKILKRSLKIKKENYHVLNGDFTIQERPLEVKGMKYLNVKWTNIN